MKIMFSSYLRSWHISGNFRSLTQTGEKNISDKAKNCQVLFNKKNFLSFMCLKRLYSDSALTSDATHLSERALLFVLDKGCQGGASWQTEESDRLELWWSYKMWQSREKSEICFCSCPSYRRLFSGRWSPASPAWLVCYKVLTQFPAHCLKQHWNQYWNVCTDKMSVWREVSVMCRLPWCKRGCEILWKSAVLSNIFYCAGKLKRVSGGYKMTM